MVERQTTGRRTDSLTVRQVTVGDKIRTGKPTTQQLQDYQEAIISTKRKKQPQQSTKINNTTATIVFSQSSLHVTQIAGAKLTSISQLKQPSHHPAPATREQQPQPLTKTTYI